MCLWNTYKCLKYLKDGTVRNNWEYCALNGPKFNISFFLSNTIMADIQPCRKAQALNKLVVDMYSSSELHVELIKVHKETKEQLPGINDKGLRGYNDCVQGKMKKSKAPSTRRAQIQHLYQRYASGQMTLPACVLLKFLHKEQMELTANEETAESLIDRYEIEETGKRRESCVPYQAARCSLLWVKNVMSVKIKALSRNDANLDKTGVKV